MDTGTLARVFGGVPGTTADGSAARRAAEAIRASVEDQTPISIPWESIRLAADMARAQEQVATQCRTGLSLSQVVYGFTARSVAEQYIGVREVGRNRGPEVEEFQDTVGGQAGGAWCAAFVSHCHYEAASFLCADTTCPRTFRAVMMIFDGRDAGNLTFSKQSVLDGVYTPIAGDVFVMVTQGSVHALDHGKPRARRKGHTGLVVSYDSASQTLTTIEGNTDPGGSREGDGVYLRTDRMTSSKLWGFMRPRVQWI